MRLAIALALALALAVACGGDDGPPTATVVGEGEAQGNLPTATIALTNDAGDRAELTVELAVTAEQRSRGLMFREELAEERGMLFVFAEDTMTQFWMKDTSIPLSIAFVAEGGTVLDIQEMEPFSTRLHRPPQAYRFALEVNQGWFGRHGFEAGDRVEIPETITDSMEGE